MEKISIEQFCKRVYEGEKIIGVKVKGFNNMVKREVMLIDFDTISKVFPDSDISYKDCKISTGKSESIITYYDEFVDGEKLLGYRFFIE